MRQVISPSAAGSGCFWCGNIDRRLPPRKGRNDTRNRGSDRRVVIPSVMEDSMCWEMDYRWLAEQKKAEETKAKQRQRSEAIEKLLSEANKPADKPEEAAPVREIIPAK
jgi:hypothetical protein